MVQKGKTAPKFCLPDENGENTCLKDQAGSWVVLYFYPKDNTPGCTIEAKDFSCATEDFQELKTTIIGVSPDSQKSHTNFISKQDLKVKLLSDEDHSTLEKYGAWQLKKMYGREYYGVVRSTFLIDPKGKIAHIWPKVNVKGHVDEVKKKIEELQGK